MGQIFRDLFPVEDECVRPVVQESSEGDPGWRFEAGWDGEGHTGSSAPLTAPSSSHPQVLHQLPGERRFLHHHRVLRGNLAFLFWVWAELRGDPPLVRTSTGWFYSVWVFCCFRWVVFVLDWLSPALDWFGLLWCVLLWLVLDWSNMILYELD